ncbi:hypothetical protein [Streptomyces sp. JB150]|uniref:hypothetical protein n=1 Tax=Streptomyces sp. JB150 TaxID=2714844 RepID=UPI001407CEFE|nr:hypothetical protein [Streptomyces sp. JB150]QIJ62585.1 hypothetical protein G7Z13_11460 [Streptomyces sp. JB150]
MSQLSIAALAVGAVSFLGLCAGLRDAWFLGLLSLTCMLAGADAAYQEREAWAITFLSLGALLALAAVSAAYRDRVRERR